MQFAHGVNIKLSNSLRLEFDKEPTTYVKEKVEFYSLRGTKYRIYRVEILSLS